MNYQETELHTSETNGKTVVAVCYLCGVVVYNTVAHDNFHARNR